MTPGTLGAHDRGMHVDDRALNEQLGSKSGTEHHAPGVILGKPCLYLYVAVSILTT